MKRKKTARKAVTPIGLFPNETPAYRKARDRLLKAEIALRRQVEKVAKLRRKLPLGGVVPEDFEFDEAADVVGMKKIRLSELFAPGKDTLILYNYMFSLAMGNPCPMCTSILDSLEGAAPHIVQCVNMAVVAKVPLPRLLTFARNRGWRNLHFLSAADNSFNRIYKGEDEEGHQNPMMHIFVRRNGKIRHFWASELFYAKPERGQNMRHVDMIWPLWNLLDLTPEGRGRDWYPRLSY